MKALKHLTSTTYWLPAAVLGAALFGLALSLTLPHVLAPKEYAKFSLLLSVVQLTSSLGYEWIRVAVIRYAGQASNATDSAIRTRHTLRSLYVYVSALLITVSAMLFIGQIWYQELIFPAIICIVAVAQGVFDGRSAWARARFENISLAITMVARPIATLLLVVVMCYFSHSAGGAAIGLGMSYLVTMLIFRDRAKHAFVNFPSNFEQTRSLLSFGVVAAVGTNLSLAIPAALRAVLITTLGITGSGGALLALDLSQRLFATIGMALNLLHLQTLIRTIDTTSVEHSILRIRSSLTLEIALYAWLIMICAVASSSIGNMVAPLSFQADFIRSLPSMSLLMATLCLRQFAIEPLFIGFKRVAFLPIGPAVTLILFASIFLLAHLGLVGEPLILPLLILASVTGFIAPLAVLRFFYPRCVPISAMAGFGFAALVAWWLTPALDSLTMFEKLVGHAVISTSVYAVVVATGIIFLRFPRSYLSYRRHYARKKREQ